MQQQQQQQPQQQMVRPQGGNMSTMMMGGQMQQQRGQAPMTMMQGLEIIELWLQQNHTMRFKAHYNINIQLNVFYICQSFG